MLRRECGVENNGKLLHLSIPSKTATLVPEFVVENLPLSTIATFIYLFIYLLRKRRDWKGLMLSY